MNDALRLTQTRMIIYYDKQYQLIELQEKAYFWVVRKDCHEYILLKNFAIVSIRANLFNIWRKVESLIYELDLFSRYADIHLIIFIIHLEQYQSSDSFNWRVSFSSFYIVNDQKQEKVEWIINSKIENDIHLMRVRWQNLSKNRNTWESRAYLLENCSLLVRAYERTRRQERINQRV